MVGSIGTRSWQHCPMIGPRCGQLSLPEIRAATLRWRSYWRTGGPAFGRTAEVSRRICEVTRLHARTYSETRRRRYQRTELRQYWTSTLRKHPLLAPARKSHKENGRQYSEKSEVFPFSFIWRRSQTENRSYKSV